jgi:hypothetical protein
MLSSSLTSRSLALVQNCSTRCADYRARFYAALGDLVSVQRPQWKDIKGTIRMDVPRAQRR